MVDVDAIPVSLVHVPLALIHFAVGVHQLAPTVRITLIEVAFVLGAVLGGIATPHNNPYITK